MNAQRRQTGLTLIELMIAIAIFAVLGVISYRAVSSMGDSRERVDVALNRWRTIDRVMQLIENDLTQLAPRWQYDNAPLAAPPITLVKGEERDELQLVRLDGAQGGLQRRIYRVENNRLMLVRMPASNVSNAQQSGEALLDQVKTLRWRFVNAAGQEFDTWPPPDTQDRFPAGVRIELELADAGLVKRVFALR
ncbi:MAG: type II secretion system minor pseudopilin GspJ [Betaproteobacteria bacterium]|nr:type II secretion system minor pseudopilin GspJ [Betaproteobacteria bacterium]